jgi:exopolysaccharide biosynthesis polyprenyl glycosylphosphotransferase
VSTPERTEERSWAYELLRGRENGLGLQPRLQTTTRAVGLSFGRRDYLLRRMLAAADAASIVFSLGVMVLISWAADPLHFLWGLLIVPVWVGLLGAYGLYTRDIKRISHSTVDDLPWLGHAVLVACLFTWLFFNFAPVSKLEFFDILTLGCTTVFTITLMRSIVRRLSTQMLGPERVLFVGEGDETDLLVRKMVAHPEYGLEPVGMVTPVDGRLDLDRMLVTHRPERIVLCAHELDKDTLLDLVHRCRELTLKVSILPELFSAMGPSVELDDVEGVTVLGINPPVLPRSARMMKRSLDFAASSVVLVLLAPVMALIAAGIRLESKGPVFFRQQRVGKAGQPFELFKFRTMVAGAEGQTEELMELSAEEGWLKLDHDPRVTRIGRLLRLTSLDELPQLWNIVKGQMSLVGPRPLIESEDRLVGGWARSRLELTPGLTGLWQVLGRTNIPFEEMVKLDYLYVTNWSLWSDIRLILRTLPAVATRRGAN